MMSHLCSSVAIKLFQVLLKFLHNFFGFCLCSAFVTFDHQSSHQNEIISAALSHVRNIFPIVFVLLLINEFLVKPGQYICSEICNEVSQLLPIHQLKATINKQTKENKNQAVFYYCYRGKCIMKWSYKYQILHITIAIVYTKIAL